MSRAAASIADGALFIPFGIIAVGWSRIQERRFHKSLALGHRTLSWQEVEHHLREGAGTLIIEQAQKQPCRFWWTSDDLRTLAPVPIPPFGELDLMLLNSPFPFVRWCFERYLSPVTGCAFLTRPTGLRFPPGFTDPDFFITRFPSARVTATTHLAKRDRS